MERDELLSLNPAGHPDPKIQRVGFDLGHPYVEQCWGPVLGPSGTMLLRRLPTLWNEQAPASITHEELSRSLGLGAGGGAHSRLRHALDRTVRFGLAKWDTDGRDLSVFLQVPALNERQLERLPEWTQGAHGRLLDDHLRGLAQGDVGMNVSDITRRLDRLQQPQQTNPALAQPSPTLKALER